MTILAAGGTVGVLPEGFRGRGEVERASHGTGYLAQHAGWPVVPVAPNGTAEPPPPTRGLPRCRPHVRVGFGEPLTVGGGPRATRHAVTVATEQIEGAVAVHLAATRSPGGVGSADVDLAGRTVWRSPR